MANILGIDVIIGTIFSFSAVLRCCCCLAIELNGIRSGNGDVGACEYLNKCCFSSVGDVVPSILSCPPEPVEPTSVWELRFDGDDGPLNVFSDKKK